MWCTYMHMILLKIGSSLKSVAKVVNPKGQIECDLQLALNL